MSWKDEIKKAQFQGPRQQYVMSAGVKTHLKTSIMALNNILEAIENGEVAPKGGAELMRREIDSIHESMIEFEKYGGSAKYNEAGQREVPKRKQAKDIRGTKFNREY